MFRPYRARVGVNGEVIKDNVTGYDWQRCSVGQTWSASTQTCDGTAGSYDWDTAMANCLLSPSAAL